jgi:hypothetical protein
VSFFNKTTEQPMVIDDDNGQRLTFTFSVEGLTAREEMLFKGYVRLLDHLTEHHWQYHEPSALHRVDLLVCSEHVQPTRFSQNIGQPQALLQLGASNLNRSAAFLTWPLKPNELENQLNRLGRLISGSAADTQSEDEPITVPAASNDAAADTKPSVSQYRLREWPKPTLMAVAGRMRLATLLIGKAMSLEEMVFRSALPLSVCERFLADMQTAGLLIHSESAASHDPARVASPAKKPSLPAAQERQAELPVVKAVIQPGLIARIRMRFGIKSPRAQ